MLGSTLSGHRVTFC